MLESASRGGLLPGGVSAPGGSGLGGWCLLRGGSAPGGVCSRGGSGLGGLVWRGGVCSGEGVLSFGGIPTCTEADPRPPVNRMTNR